jgi:dolichol-phosphate mannosyltransferase
LHPTLYQQKDPMNKSLSLSIVMPALNEEANIFVAINDTLKAFDSFNINGELIVVNDGSEDKTPEIIEEFCKKDQRVKVISHTSPQGIGASFWDGVDHSMNESISMLPGDGENNPDEIIRYLNLLNHVDMVIPFVFNPQVRPLWRSALSFVYRFIINTTFLVNFNYTNGTVLYRKTILEALSIRNQSFFFQTDILIRSVKRGYLFAEVPYCLGTRGSGDSKAVSYPSLIRVIKGYLRLLKDFYFNKEWNTKQPFAENTSTAQRYKSSQK